MIKVNRTSSDADAADSYIENGPKDSLTTTSSFFSNDSTTVTESSNNNTSGSSSTGIGGGSSITGDNLPGSSNESTGSNPRQRERESGGQPYNGPAFKRSHGTSTRNPITGNESRQRTSLGQSLSSVVGGIGSNTAMSLWTALLCGVAPITKTGTSKSDMNLWALWLRSTGCSAENLIDFLQIEGGRVGLNQALLKERLNGATQQSLTTLNQETRTVLINDLAARSGQEPNEIEARLNGQTTTVRNGDAEDVGQLQRMLSGVTGAEEVIEVFDLHAEVTVLNAILERSIELGIPQAATALIAKIEDDKVRQRVLLKRVRQAAIESDLQFINTTLDHTSAERVRAEVPDIVDLIVRYYRIGRTTPRSEYPNKRQELIDLLTRINPKWNQQLRGTEWVYRLAPYQTASRDAETLFLRDTDHEVPMMLARKFPRRYIQQVAQRNFPRAAL